MQNIDDIFAPFNADRLATGFGKRSANVKVIAVPGNINMIIGYVGSLRGLQ
jgi:hypothetical protein